MIVEDPHHNYSVLDTVNILLAAHEMGIPQEHIESLTIAQLDVLVRKPIGEYDS